MKNNYLIILLAIFIQIGVVNAQNVSTPIFSVTKYGGTDGIYESVQNSDLVTFRSGGTYSNIPPSFNIGIYFSKDKNHDTNDKLIKQEYVSANTTYFLNDINLSIPCNNTYTGKVYVILFLDNDKQINETYENDNIAIDSINISTKIPCGYLIDNVTTNETINSQIINNINKSDYSSNEIVSSIDGISGTYIYYNNTLNSIDFYNYPSFYLSTIDTFDFFNGLKLENTNPKSLTILANSSQTIEFNNIYYKSNFLNNYQKLLDGYYYLFIVNMLNNITIPFENGRFDVIEKSNLLKIGTFNDNDIRIDLPTLLTLNSPYSVNLSNYLKGRETRYGSVPACFTSKVAANTVDYFVKFKATETSMTISLNADDASLESVVELMTSPKTCNSNFQSGNNVRNYTFDNLTIGNEYTARVEFGGDAPIGYARMEALTNTTVTLKSGTVTSLSASPTIVFSIYPNPSNDGRFSVNTTETIQQIKVTNALGQTEVFNATNEIKTSLKGLLFVEVLTLNGKATSKVVVE